MFEVYYNDAIVSGRGPTTPGLAASPKRSYTQDEIDGLGVDHLNTRIDKVGDLYVLRAFTAVIGGKKYIVERDVSFPHVSDDFSGWLIAKKPGPASVVIHDNALLNWGTWVTEFRERYYAQFGRTAFNLFTTIRGCCEVGKECEEEELCLDMNRVLLPDELPADQVDLPPPNPIEAFHELNTKLLQDARAALAEYVAAKSSEQNMMTAVASKKWDDLTKDEKDFVLRKTAEKLGIIKRD